MKPIDYSRQTVAKLEAENAHLLAQFQALRDREAGERTKRVRLAEENERLRALLARLYTICLQDSIRDANLSDDFDDALDESGAALAREEDK